MAGTWTPPVDRYETDAALVLTAERPGVAQEAVSLEIHNNTLVLRGERQPEAGVSPEAYYRAERAYGPFQRALVLPTMVAQEPGQATSQNGILELRRPKLERAKPMRIAIAR